MRKILLLLVALSWSAAPAVSQPRPPEEVLGFQVGADRKLADWPQIVEYFQSLASSSPRIDFQVLGPTTEDNPFVMAAISSPENLGRLDRLQDIQAQLADPRKRREPLEQLLAEGRTVVLITCAIHSTEVASAQMSMEFAWEMATREDEETAEILENVLFLFVPSLNPDGVNLVNRWYKETVDTPAEGTSPPALYHKYVGHDNNRDWYMFTQKETRLAVERIHNVWRPQIVYDVHQMGGRGARIFVPPFIDPIDQNVDPLLQAQIVDLGGAMFSALIGAGRKGIVTQAIYDGYTPARAYQHYHGGVRILSESASVRIASPVEVKWDELGPGRNYDAKTASWNFPVPWPGGTWRLRDIVEDQKIALRACLLHAARYRSNWLKNFSRIADNAVERSTPYAFVLPPESEQADPDALFDLLDVLDFADVEIERSSRQFAVEASRLTSTPRGRQGRTEFPAGSYVIRPAQPYGAFAKTMLEVQVYPELREVPGGPLIRPYDVTAHSLGIQLGVETYQVDQPFEASLNRVESWVRKPTVSGGGDYWIFSHSNNAFARLTNRLLKAGLPVSWAQNGFQVEGKSHPVGTLMTYAPGREADLEELIADLPVRPSRSRSWPQLAWLPVRAPKIGLFQSYRGSMDEGWTRWILEQHEFNYESLRPADLKNGTGLDRFDIIVFADESPRAILDGLPDTYPEPFRGGIGTQGVANLKAFAEQGGTILFLGESCLLPLRSWELGVKEVLGDLGSEKLYIPGSFLLSEVHNRHPIAFGMDGRAPLMFDESQAFEVELGVSIVKYPEQSLLLSGWIDGEQYLKGKTALTEIPLERGRIVLVGFRSQFRAQFRATYKYLFNTLYYATTF